MGGRQSKGRQQLPDEAQGDPPGCRKKSPGRDRGDFLRGLVLRSGERCTRSPGPPPYQKRIAMIQDMATLAKQGRQEEASNLLRNLRQVSVSVLSLSLSPSTSLPKAGTHSPTPPPLLPPASHSLPHLP
ncbi:hypothetical protein chiPu_0023917 [Chiloscyllium punctatum]|uniref:Uncharacterized protein n=1 Tax=Chiloscyllium punctatum TaxID=137246 RepID=A0A401TA82_CHIPU|nr:hypothetical protein [Chiloscyllium punctatum]